MTSRKWRIIGVLGNILILVFTASVTWIIAKAGINAVFFPATTEYQFMHKEVGAIVAVIIGTLASGLGVWTLLVASDTAEKLLKFLAKQLRKIAKRNACKAVSALKR